MPPDILDAPGQPQVSNEPFTPSQSPGAPAQSPVTPGAGGTPQPTTPPAPPPQPPPPPPKENVENLNAFVEDFVELTQGDVERKKRDDAAAAARGTPPATPPPAPPKPKKPKGAAPPKPAAPPPSMSAEQIAELAAKTALETARATAPPPAPKAPELDAEDAEAYEVYKHLEEMHPEHKGIADHFKKVQLLSYEYTDKWEKEHPGQEFDPESPEHEEWRRTSGFDEFVKPEDAFDDARLDLMADKKLQAKLDGRLGKIEQAERLREATPEIVNHVVASRKTLWRQLGKDYADVIAENGVPNTERIQQIIVAEKTQIRDLITKSPGLVDAMLDGEVTLQPPTVHRLNAARALDAEVPEIYRLMNGLAEEKPAPPVAEVRRAILQFGAEMERDLAAQPADQQLDGQGRKFLATDRYYALPRDKRAGYWTLTPDLVIAARTAHWAKEAGEKIAEDRQKLTAWATANNVQVPAEAIIHAPTPTPPGRGQPAPSDGKPKSPSLPGQSKLAALKNASAPPASDALSTWAATGF